jgi:hypothetical protein
MENIGIEVTFDEGKFLCIKETLTRMGVASKKDKILYQSCHILHKQGRYFVVHFKELFLLDGKHADISENDLSRRNAIAKLLQDWELVEILYQEDIEDPPPLYLSQIKILSHKEKNDWELSPKYQIGKKLYSS